MADAGAPLPPKSYPAEKARQGDIILRKPWRRIVYSRAVSCWR
jgi:hypothetical protein